MPVTNLTHSLNLSSTSNYYLNHPTNGGISSGYWFYYSASAANSTVPGKIVPYRWGNKLTTAAGAPLTLVGTIPLNSESLNRQRIFHGSTITRIGPGVNDITLAQEADAFFFYHMGSIAASDNPGYWDRAYQLTVGGSEWEYYQYHLHSPNVYASFDNARIANSGFTFINPSDKQFGYIQPIQVSSMGTSYLNALARIHRPSVGGAHNSHYDVELGSSTNRNYQIGGIIPGVSNRYHAFYITDNGNQWDVLSRTYVLSNGSFTAEVNHGTYNLATPSINVTSKEYSRYPVRAAAGALNGPDAYIPLIYSGSGNTFDTKVWKFPSTDTIATSDIVVTTITSGSTQRSDVHLTVANQVVNAVVSYNSAASGSIEYYKYSGSAWIKQGTVITNGPQDVLRIHGFEYNAEDNLYYVLVSGNVTGSVGTYTGPGVYSFSDGTVFTGYQHLSFLTASYGFVLRDPLESGYLSYTNVDASLAFKSGSEPQAINEDFSVLQYDVASPKFLDRYEAILGGSEYFYSGTKLADGRVVLVGNIENNPGNEGNGHDLLLAIYPEADGDPEFYSYATNENDYFTGIVEDTQRRCLWMTGYTRSKLAQRRDIWVHGYGRALTDGFNKLEWKDISVDSEGNQYAVGNHLGRDAGVVAKYNYNFELVWQRDISHDSFVSNSLASVCLDSNNNTYAVGKSNNKALVVKLDATGSTLFSNLYSQSFGDYASAIAYVTKSAADYFVVPVVSGSSTTVLILDSTGSIVEQNKLNNFVVNKVRKSDYEADGYFLLAGNDGATTAKAKFAKGQVLATGNMLQWVYTYSSGSTVSNAFDIKNVAAPTAQILGSTSGSKYHAVGKDGINAFITQIVVDDNNAGVYQATKMWSKNLVSSSFTSLTYSDQEIDILTSSYSGTITFAVGYTSASAQGQGGNEGVISAYDINGNKVWTNTLGHTANEELWGVANDVLNRNIISVGWSESHTDGRRTFLFRSDAKGFGTANYFLEGAAGMPIYYTESTLPSLVSNSSITTISAPTDIAGSVDKVSGTYVNQDLQYTQEIYDGGITWNMFIAKLDLDKLQTHKNTVAHKAHNTLYACSNQVEYVQDFFTFYQAGTTGDGTADDGNFFGYDILLMTGSNNVFVVGQTSGHIQFTNQTSIPGAYDYILSIFDPATEHFEFYQSGSTEDEEMYAGTELNDGSGSIAFVGRSIGNFATSSNGGYDIFLGIYNPINDNRRYFSYGSILNDRGVNVHDLGNNELAIVFETADNVTPDQTHAGGFDIGVIKFNYANWQTTGGAFATSSYQFGSTEDEFLSQEGKPSVLMPDGRIAVTGRTLGTVADDGITYGSGDGFIAILDLTDGTYKKYQAGTAGNETGTTIFYLGGGKLGVAGYTDASFTEANNAVYVTFDALIAPKARTI